MIGDPTYPRAQVAVRGSERRLCLLVQILNRRFPISTPLSQDLHMSDEDLVDPLSLQRGLRSLC
jgi:hypothetical protein